MSRGTPGFKKRRVISFRKKHSVGFKKTKRGFK
jgi:hypothetical protein